MKTRVLERSQVSGFVGNLLVEHDVVAPVEKERGSHVFAEIQRPGQVALDYVTTLLPPKKAFFPQHQPLLRFDLADEKPDVEPVIDRRPIVLFGVHPCDLAGIRMLDWAFLRDASDWHYLAKRRAATIVGVDCLPDEHCFCTSVGTAVPKNGFDLFLTPTFKGYLVTVDSEKGSDLLRRHADTREATPQDLAEAGDWQNDKNARTVRRFDAEVHNLPLILQRGVGSPAWEETSSACLSCGACNLVCPTCFCFNVEDVLDTDGSAGVRERSWDGCQLSDFARISGGTNFRRKPSWRLRHRFFRKYQYLMTQFGAAFCTGCGRCGRFCPAGINVVDTLNSIVASDRIGGEAHVA